MTVATSYNLMGPNRFWLLIIIKHLILMDYSVLFKWPVCLSACLSVYFAAPSLLVFSKLLFPRALREIAFSV